MMNVCTTPFPLPRLAAWALASCLTLTLPACKEGPAHGTNTPEPAAPFLQDGQLRFPPEHPQLSLIGVATAKPAARITMEMPARLVWNEERTQRVVPAFAGRVTRIEADLGSVVKPGTVLARMASPDFGAAQADAAKARADVEMTGKTLARQRELFEAGIVARKDMEQAEADSRRAGAELARAQARTALYGGGGAAVDQQLALRAGIAGIVVERNLNPGQELRPDQLAPGTPLPFVISDPTALWVQIDAREAEVGTLKPGSTFQLSASALGERTFEGRIIAVSDAIDPTTRTVKVRGLVDNKDRLLRAEMLATARFERTQGAGVAVPAAAVTLRGTTHWVFVQRAPGVFETKEVKLSFLGPQQAVVSNGLEVGDQVVTDNLLLLARQFRLAQQDAPAVGAEKAGQGAPAASAPRTPNAPASK